MAVVPPITCPRPFPVLDHTLGQMYKQFMSIGSPGIGCIDRFSEAEKYIESTMKIQIPLPNFVSMKVKVFWES